MSKWVLLVPLGLIWAWYALDFHPTVTELVHANRDKAWMVILVGAVIGGLTTWAWQHLLVEGR